MIIKSTSNLWHVDFKRKIFQKHKQQQNREFAKKKEEKKKKNIWSTEINHHGMLHEHEP